MTFQFFLAIWDFFVDNIKHTHYLQLEVVLYCIEWLSGKWLYNCCIMLLAVNNGFFRANLGPKLDSIPLYKKDVFFPIYGKNSLLSDKKKLGSDIVILFKDVGNN